MKDITVSVIVPCYKGEKYIAHCVENLLSQSYKNLEIIVVIDGNVDKSAEIARQYPVNVIVLEKNQGLSAARNAGIKACHGDYVHFMDVDDSINKDFYLNMAKAVSETDADIACAGIINRRKAYKCQLFDKMKVLTSNKDKFSATWVAKWGYVWRYLFRKSFLLANNLEFEVGRLIEDMPFSFKALYFADKIVTVPGTSYVYESVEGSIMNRTDLAWVRKRRQDFLHSRAVIRSFAKEHNISAPGLGYNVGIVRYVIRKLYKNAKSALGFKCF